jgi:tripartite ATP-independent transporter DctM subunit
MSPITIALIGLTAMFLLMILRMPISFAMFLAGFVGFGVMTSPKAAYSIVSTEIWLGFSSYGLSVIPLFVLMGQIVFRSGATESLYDAAYKWVGHLKGGMAGTTILASTVFSAICGSNMATTATMGTIALPEMKKYGYNKALSAGSVAAGGTLGVVIPPSVVLIIIALQTEQSIARLFIASVIPGLLLSLLFLLTISAICIKFPEYGPAGPRASWKERLTSLPGVLESLVLFFFIIGGLYLGWFTPTEAGAAGSFGAIMIALLQRKLTWGKFALAVTDTLRISAMVIMLVIGAVVFGRFLAITRLPFVLAEWAAALPVPPLAILAVVIFIYLVGGAFMDALGFLTISIPIFFPLAIALGYDPLWYTVLITIITTMGAITPPVGVNAYIVNGLAPDIPIETVFKGVGYFMMAYVACVLLIIAFPKIVLFLPQLLF